LEKGLTRIVRLSWKHNQGGIGFATVTRLSGQPVTPAIVIEFSAFVDVSKIDAEHVFQVLLRHPDENPENAFLCRCPVSGEVIPVGDLSPGPVITTAKEVPTSMAMGGAFLFDSNSQQLLDRSNEVWVMLRGDFVLDEKGRAIDAEFTRGELPTGDRPSGSDFGVQGGLFESWFWRDNRTNGRREPIFSVARATVEELASLPDIKPALARAIVKSRTEAPSGRFRALEELLTVSGMTRKIFQGIRNRLTVE
jgi:hypothetical protein